VEHRVTASAAASPDEVWRLFTDWERWPEMTQSIRALRRLDSGPVKVGSAAVVRQPRLPPVRWRVTELDPGRSFIWEARSLGVVTMGGHLVEEGEQGSVITLTLRHQGPLASLMDALTSRLSDRYISMELEGFRRTAEAGRR
jgi:uncharacterized membrane protein